MPGHHRHRTVVLGLDGLGLTTAQSLAPSLPALRHIALDSRATTMRAELPELSPVNWTSLYTGLGPGSHGVFGFTRVHGYDYSVMLADSTTNLAPTIFERLGDRGQVSRVVNLPNTYPARPLNGSMVAGFIAPDLERAVYPPTLAAELSRGGYKLEADTERGQHDPALLLEELHATLKSRRLALDMLWQGCHFDLFVLVLTETDRIGHFLFPALIRPDHPWRARVMELMQAWDELIAEVLERFEKLPEPKRLLVLADHGFTETRTEVELNAWLEDQGYLVLEREPKGELDLSAISPETRAFALDPGRIYLHTMDRFSRGRLSPDQALTLREELQRGLSGLTWQGQEVMERVYAREELYQGPAASRAPDLNCLARPGFDLHAKLGQERVFGLKRRTGCHTACDVLAFDSLGERPISPRDMGRLVLSSQGLAPPRDPERDQGHSVILTR